MEQQNSNANPWTGETNAGTTAAGGGIGVTSATDGHVCPHCGQSANRSQGLEQFLRQLGINDEMIGNLKSQFQDVNLDEYLNTAREYLKDSSNKATAFAKDNPGKVAAGAAALAFGAGLMFASMSRDRE